MKKIVSIIIFLAVFFMAQLPVHAAASLGVNTSSVTVGGSFTVSVNVFAAAWNVHVSASGPVSGCSINQADTSADAMNTSKTFTANCTATGAGTINISLSGDVTM